MSIETDFKVVIVIKQVLSWGKGKTIAGVPSQFYHRSFNIAIIASQEYHRSIIA